MIDILDVVRLNDERLRFLAVTFILIFCSLSVDSTSYLSAKGQLAAKLESEQFEFYHSDYLGSTRAITDGEGRVLVEQDTLPFGETLSGDERYGFTGKELDESGLQYFGARYYDSGTGRFISVDPLKDGMNWYSYARNNPLRYIDPTGNEVVEVRIFDEAKFKDKGLTTDMVDNRVVDFLNIMSQTSGAVLGSNVLTNDLKVKFFFAELGGDNMPTIIEDGNSFIVYLSLPHLMTTGEFDNGVTLDGRILTSDHASHELRHVMDALGGDFPMTSRVLTLSGNALREGKSSFEYSRNDWLAHLDELVTFENRGYDTSIRLYEYAISSGIIGSGGKSSDDSSLSNLRNIVENGREMEMARIRELRGSWGTNIQMWFRGTIGVQQTPESIRGYMRDGTGGRVVPINIGGAD